MQAVSVIVTQGQEKRIHWTRWHTPVSPVILRDLRTITDTWKTETASGYQQVLSTGNRHYRRLELLLALHCTSAPRSPSCVTRLQSMLVRGWAGRRK